MEEAERRANLQEDNDEEDEEEEARVQDEDDDEDCIPVRTEIDENIPLTKPGYEPIPVTTFPPIKVPHLQPSPLTIFATIPGILVCQRRSKLHPLFTHLPINPPLME